MPVKDYKAYYAANRERFKEYHRASYQRNKKQRYATLVERRNKLRSVVIAIKAKPCMDCHILYPHMCMEFDHREPSKKRLSIATMVAQCYAIEEILVEISKCDLVCSNCHAIRTWRQQHERNHL
jgi:predicted HNH restriction endonuclease